MLILLILSYIFLTYSAVAFYRFVKLKLIFRVESVKSDGSLGSVQKDQNKKAKKDFFIKVYLFLQFLSNSS